MSKKLMHSSVVFPCFWVSIVDELQNAFGLENRMDYEFD